MTKSKIKLMLFDPGKVNVFMDGSKNNTSSGAVYLIKGHSVQKQQFFNLGQYTTVHQAEILAINMASIAILEEEIQGEQINFYIDSKSVIGALCSYTVQDKSWLNAKGTLISCVSMAIM